MLLNWIAANMLLQISYYLLLLLLLFLRMYLFHELVKRQGLFLDLEINKRTSFQFINKFQLSSKQRFFIGPIIPLISISWI